MSDKHESMIGIMKLYELRREPVMREARNWFAAFYAGNFQDVEDVLKNGDDAYFRMVLTYWEMAAAFVNHGAIDEQLFNEANVEHLFVFSKVEPFINEFRAALKNPNLLANLEKLVLRIPNAKETMAGIREQAKAKQSARESAVATTA